MSDGASVASLSLEMMVDARMLGVARTRIGISATHTLTGHVVSHVDAVVKGLCYQFENAYVGSHL